MGNIECEMIELPQNNGTSHSLSCTYDVDDIIADHLNEIIPGFANNKLELNVNFIIVQDLNGEGNFSLDNAEDVTYLNGLTPIMNNVLGNIFPDSECNNLADECQVAPEVYSTFHLKIVPTFYELKTEHWDHLVSDLNPTLNSTNGTDYLDLLHSELTQDPDFTDGVNIFMTSTQDSWTRLIIEGGSIVDDPRIPLGYGTNGSWYSGLSVGGFSAPAFIHNPDMWPEYYHIKVFEPWALAAKQKWQAKSTLHEIFHQLMIRTGDGVNHQHCCATNIMRGRGGCTPTPSNAKEAISGCQAREVYESLMGRHMRQFVSCAESFEEEIIISGSEEWTSDMKMFSNIRIMDGGELTITCIMEMQKNGRIYIEEGGRLNINGGVVTSCDQWKGIRAEGNLAANNSAEIHITNGGVLENARNAISDDVGSGRGGMIVVADDGEFRNNWRDIEFMNTKQRNLSTFDNSSFIGGQLGVTIWSSNGIEFYDCVFSDISDIAIVTYDASLRVDDDCDFSGSKIAIKNTNTYPTDFGIQILDSDFADNNVDVFSTGSAGSYRIRKNNFSGLSQSIYMDGDNFYNIEKNDFNDSEIAALMLSCGGSPNDFSDNFLSSSVIGDLAVYDNSRTEFIGNCYDNGAFSDIIVDGEIFEFQGSPDESAGNCFSGSALGIIADNSNDIEYYVKDINAQDCSVPSITGNVSILNATNERNSECGTGNSRPSTRSYCNLGPFDSPFGVFIEISRLQRLINQINLNITIDPIVKRYLLAYYNRCLRSLMFRRGEMLVSVDSIDEAVIHFDTLQEFDYKIRAYGVMIGDQRYLQADLYLDQIYSTTEAELEFVDIQKLNLQRLMSNNEFEFSESQLSYIKEVGLRTNPYAAYARSLYHIVTGEILYVDYPTYISEPQFRITPNNNLGISGYSINPNPSSSFINLQLPSEAELDNVEYFLYNINGVLVRNKSKLDYRNVISVNDLPNGLYFLQVADSDNFVYSENIIIAR